MYRKTICVIIITAMVTHCAARLGFLSYLYEKRHDIAFSVGLITEKPITVCSHTTDIRTGLVLQTAVDQHKALVRFSIIPDITLFVQKQPVITNSIPILAHKPIAADVESRCEAGHLLEIFHPPSALNS